MIVRCHQEYKSAKKQTNSAYTFIATDVIFQSITIIYKPCPVASLDKLNSF